MASNDLTPNQIKSLHPAVRFEFKAGRLTDAQAHTANRLIREPYQFKSRIAIRAAVENLKRSGIEKLHKALKAMPSDAPAKLLEDESFAVLGKKKSLDEAVTLVSEAAVVFRKKKKESAERPTKRPEPEEQS